MSLHPTWQSFLLALLLLAPALNAASAQNKDDFRTAASGNWFDPNTWELYDGTSWVPAGSPPAANDGYITIRGGHTVTLTADEQVEDTTVEPAGRLVISPGVTLELKSGDDTLPELGVHGILENAGRVLLGVSNGKVEIQFFGGSRYEHAQNGGTIPNPVDTGAQWDAGSTCAITGVTSTLPSYLGQALHHVEWNAPLQSVDLDVSGRLNVSGNLKVVSTGSHQLVSSGASTVSIGGSYLQTGGTFRISYGLGDVSFSPGRDFSVSGGAFYMDPASATFTLNVPGDYTHAGGRIEKRGAGSADIVLSGSANQAIYSPDTVGTGIDLYLDNPAGATLQTNLTVPQDLTVLQGMLDLAGRTLTLQDDLTVEGSLSTTGTLLFASSAPSDPQVLGVSSGTISAGSLTLDSPGGTLQVGVGLTLFGDLARQSGTLQLGSRRLTFSGAQDQRLYDAAGTMLIENIAVDKPSGSLILESDLQVSRNLSLASGMVDITANEAVLTLISNSTTGRVATVTSGDGRVSGPYHYERYYSVSNAGWRMIGVPFAQVPYSAFNDDFFTQGGDWADHSRGSAILYRFDADGSLAGSAQSWEAITGGDAPLEAGEGYIFYMIKEDPDSLYSYLPATLDIAGNEPAAFTKTLAFNTTPADSYNLVGNPFAGVLDWHALVGGGTNLGTSYAAWNPDGITGGGTSGHRYYNSTDQVGAAGRYIAPFQAFFVQATGTGASIDFQKTMKSNSQAPAYYGKLAQSKRRDGPSPHVRLHLKGEELAEPETYLVFNPDAERGSDPSDVRRLPGLGAEQASLWFTSGEGDRPLAFDGRSMNAGREEYELALTTTRAGRYELSWPVWHDVPADWSFVLTDPKTGAQIDMRSQSSYAFQMKAAAPSSGKEHTPSSLPPPSRQLTIRITGAAPASPEGEAPGGEKKPEATRLYQNYPNPFAGATKIPYDLAESGPVRIQLFDLLGKVVARPVDGYRPAGHHEAHVDAAGLSAGVYLYVLEAGGATLTRRMVILR